MRLGWKQTFETGVPKIDRQHQQLFEMLNELLEHEKNAFDERQIFQLLNALVKYAEEHFTTEEKYLRFYKYPKLEEHQRQHLGFLQEITRLTQKLEEHQANLLPVVLEFLKQWYLTHIGESDHAYAEYLVKNRLVNPPDGFL
jgi:hemerythrin